MLSSIAKQTPIQGKRPLEFHYPCDISHLHINNALADLGASISVMPYMIYEKLGLGEPKPTRMGLEIADRSIQYPYLIAENVLIRIDKFIFPIFNVASLADKAILSGADNRPSMLEKDMYDSWKSKMELYMLNRQHGRMILESVKHGPLFWPTVEEDGVTRLKKYYELSVAEAIQADCDIKATNIILQALSSEIYALVSTHKVAKDLWERIQMLMQGTSLTKQERECKFYDEFDKFAYRKGETLRDFYLRFSLLLNDMNMYNMKLKEFQVNTKFLNTLPPEWSKFVTDVKLVRDLHTANI
nr:hypothetical protein [Tanacetum cinerariifolium]